MAERENWIQETDGGGGTTTFTVAQRNRDHLRVIKIALMTIGGGLILSILLISPGGGLSILGYILLAFVLFFGAVVGFACIIIMLVSMGVRATVSFAVTPDQVLLTRKVKDGYPGAIDRSHIAGLYVDGGPQGGQVTSSSRVIIGSPTYVAVHGTAQAMGDISSSIGRGMGAALAASRYSVTLNANAKTIHLTNALTQAEAEYLMHRIELAWAR